MFVQLTCSESLCLYSGQMCMHLFVHLLLFFLALNVKLLSIID